MRIKGHEITILENHPNEPWPVSICYDGQRMDYNHIWESTPAGAVIYYKSPDDKSIFQGVRFTRKELQRIIAEEVN